jgi:glycosyltransferase involved in cell wall biosynthesis/aminoglycoside phosphotransferase
MIDRTKPPRVRAVVLFDTAGFLRSLPLTGAATRTLELNRHLAGHGVDVTLLLCDLNPRSQPTQDWPFPVQYVDVDAMYSNGDPLKPVVSQLGPDVVLMSNTELTVRYGRQLADAAGAALIYEMHDNEAALQRGIGHSTTKTRQTAALQTAAARLADAVITFTRRDHSTAAAMGANRVFVVPCGVSHGPPPGPSTQRRPAAVAFVGNLFYEPNVRAIRFLQGHVRERLTSLGGWIDVYGRYPSTLSDLAVPGIRLHGPVVDLQAALGTAEVGVAPLDCGGGMKLKVLSYMAAGLAVVGTTEALVGLPDPRTFALVSTAAAMADFPDLVTGLVEDRAMRRRLGQAGRRLALNQFSWPVLAAHAAYVYRTAAHHTTSPRSGAQVPANTRQLADQKPYWLLEWLSRKEPIMDDHAAAVTRHPILAPWANEIECARQAAESHLGIAFDGNAIPGYGGRSIVFFGHDAVLKIYTHRPQERARREMLGFAVGGNRPGVTTPSVLGHNDVPGALSWVAMSKLPGQPPTDPSDRDATGLLGTLAARLHTTPAQDLSDLPPFVRNIRPLPADIPTQVIRLAAMLDDTKHRQLAHCRPGFVHGDFSARNILLAADHDPGVIDFEGCGVGCVYEDLTNLYVQNCLIDGRDVHTMLAGYHAEYVRLGGEVARTDPGHLLFHTGLYLRWVLQWAPEVDPALAAQILTFVVPVLDALENDPDQLP